MDVTEIAKIVTHQMDKLITTIKSLQGIKTVTMQAEHVLYGEAVYEAVRLYHQGDIDWEEFCLAASSLKEDTWDCVAFCQMSDELCIAWITERAKEGGRRTRNTKA